MKRKNQPHRILARRKSALRIRLRNLKALQRIKAEGRNGIGLDAAIRHADHDVVVLNRRIGNQKSVFKI